MPRLVILRGNSGSGKTTIAKRLRKELGYETMLVSQDVVRKDILRVRDTPNNPSRQLIYEMVKYGHSIGYDVVVEGILSKSKYGTMLMELSRLFDETHAYYFDLPFEETLRRHSTKPNAHEFGEKEMREWWKEKDFLSLDGEQIISSEQTEDEIVAQIMKDCAEL